MPKNIPALKHKKLIKILEKGDHCLYLREIDNQRRIPLIWELKKYHLLMFDEF
ncbi:MAG: hypothetical protein DSM107014_04580 [Gomphosphaeria aponina SAG 52.96 = DSM 107014]|uniref:Uncharacterized protein n=1 Tax=Gomphosphaeria aponina SAG 52.96 = DSM 107014 TaxID=1521640 RepID=A0A941JP61_9CHRO|nr:hypothetical protein [Gomphosphaeria aponina SAG 52.96 = DSM 107014]